MFRSSPYSLFDANLDDSTPSLRDYTNADELDWESDVDADSLLPSFLPSNIFRCIQETVDDHEHDAHVSPSKSHSSNSETDSSSDHDEPAEPYALVFTDVNEITPETSKTASEDKASIEHELHTRLYEVILKYPRLKSKIRQLVSECGFTETQQTLPPMQHPLLFTSQYHARGEAVPFEVTQLIDDMTNFVREFGAKQVAGYRRD